MAVAAAAACTGGPAVISKQADARQLAARLHLEFTLANEAANRAVMADTDEASEAAAKESEQASRSVEQSLEQLRPMLRSLAYEGEMAGLERFAQKFDEYRKIDAEVLPLAVENTNLKAQRLSFGSGQESANAVFAALTAATATGPPSGEGALEAARCQAAILEIQVIQARHIAEADEAGMARMEAEMSAQEQAARAALDRLRKLLPPAAQQPLTDAAAAFYRFIAVNREIIQLSRRNSNVRSLALTLGRKRVVAAECEDQLRTLEDALAKHAFAATR
jgi:hypothetical protein